MHHLATGRVLHKRMNAQAQLQGFRLVLRPVGGDKVPFMTPVSRCLFSFTVTSCLAAWSSLILFLCTHVIISQPDDGMHEPAVGVLDSH